MVNTLVSLVKIKWQVELTWAVFSLHFQATNLTILVFYPTLFSEIKGKKLDWFSYTFGFWISAHIKDTKKLQGDNFVEAQRSNVEVNVRESMVKVLVIETNWKQNVTKFLNSFLFFLLQENGHVDSGDYQCIDITLERVGLLYWFFKVKFVLSLS